MVYLYYFLVFFGVSDQLLSQPNQAFRKTKNQTTQNYDAIYPYYIKYCSMSRIHPKIGHGRVGGSPGHAVLYIKGACLDKTKSPFQLKVCELDKNYEDPELGVGISTNKNFKNVNFVGIPGQKLFFGKGLLRKKKFTLEQQQRVLSIFLEENILKGVDFHPHKARKEKDSEDRFFASRMFGTDYAIALARNVYCLNIPTSRVITEYLVHELNLVNQSYKNSEGCSYRGGKKKDSHYHWHGIYNNCAHTLVNLLAKLGIMGNKQINQSFFSQLGNIAIPANVLLALQKKLNTRSIDPKLYFQKKRKKEVFELFSWIPQQEGNLLQKIPFYQKNDVYKEDDIMLTIPDFFGKQSEMLRELMNIEDFKLEPNGTFFYQKNLNYYQRKYQEAIEESQKEISFYKTKNNLKKEETEYFCFLKNFVKYLENKIDNLMLHRIKN